MYVKNYKLLILIVSFFILIFSFNYSVFRNFENSIKLKNFTLLDSYKASIENSIGSDIKIIDEVDIEKEQILILQTLIERNSKKDFINIKPIGTSKFLYYNEKSRAIFIDIKKLKENLDEVLPSFIKYNLTFNNISISHKEFQEELVGDYTIGKKLNIALTLDKYSSLVKKDNEYLSTVVKYSMIISLIIVLVFITSIFFQSNNLKKVKRNMKKMRIANEAKNQIDGIFIKKASEIYAKEELKNVGDNSKLKENILNNIGNKDYIFPLMLKGKKPIKIEIDKFFKNLEKSFNYSVLKSKVEVDISTKYLDIVCEKEILYQIVYSIVSSILMLLEDQNDEVKKLRIKLLETEIIFNYNGYPMSKNNMIKLSKHITPLYSDIFFLTGSKLFNSIEYHQLTYEISSSGFDNKITLSLNTQKKENIDKKARIIKFDRRK